MKTIKLDRKSLALAREIRAVAASAKKEREAIQQAFQKRVDELQERSGKELETLWQQLHLSAGLPTEEVGEWSMDGNYLDDHGVAFLFRTPPAEEVEDHPLIKAFASATRH